MYEAKFICNEKMSNKSDTSCQYWYHTCYVIIMYLNPLITCWLWYILKNNGVTEVDWKGNGVSF